MQGAITPSVNVEQRTIKGKEGKKDSRSYRVITAQRTTSPYLGQEFSQSELDKFFAQHPEVRVNIKLA